MNGSLETHSEYNQDMPKPPPYSCTNTGPLSTDSTPHTIPHEPPYPAYISRRAVYLAQFDAQHPKELLCFVCGEYHPRKKPHEKSRWERKHPLQQNHIYPRYDCPVDTVFTQTFSQNDLWGCIMYKWPTFYEVMRGFRLGPNYGNPFLLNSFVRSPRCIETRALAVENRLLIRRRVILGLDWAPYPDYTHEWEPQKKILTVEDFCPHMRERVPRDDFMRALKDAYSLVRKHNHPNNAAYVQGFKFKTIRCTSCPTEVVMEFIPQSLYAGRLRKKYKKKPFIYCLTRYVDMGLMLHPNEMEWRSLTTWYKVPGVQWEQLPRSARHEMEDPPMEQRPRIDVTHMEPISVRFERQMGVRPEVEASS